MVRFVRCYIVLFSIDEVAVLDVGSRRLTVESPTARGQLLNSVACREGNRYMTTPREKAAEALLRCRPFYLRIPRDTLRAASSRTRTSEAAAPKTTAQAKPPRAPADEAPRAWSTCLAANLRPTALIISCRARDRRPAGRNLADVGKAFGLARIVRVHDCVHPRGNGWCLKQKLV